MVEPVLHHVIENDKRKELGSTSVISSPCQFEEEEGGRPDKKGVVYLSPR